MSWRALIALAALVLVVGPGAGVRQAVAEGDFRANFQAEPTRGGVPLTVQFTDTSNPGDRVLVRWEWSFGDGGTSEERNPTHTYTATCGTEPCKYTVTFAVTDNLGRREEKVERDAVTVDPPRLVTAVLPVSRSVMVGTPATTFVSVINSGAIPATGVGIKVDPSTAPGGVAGAPLPGTFSFQTTDPLTNQVIGVPNTAVDIPAGQTQTYVVTVVPDAPMSPTDIRFEIEGTNTEAAKKVPGLNTLLLSGSAAPVPDIVAIATTAPGTTAVRVPGVGGTEAFAVATVNVGGAGGDVTLSADTGATPLPVAVAVCRTDPANGECATPLASSVVTAMAPGSTFTFSVFVTATGVVPFDPELNRVFVRFSEGGVVRGASSVAVRSQ
jgi:PKD repeat protein